MASIALERVRSQAPMLQYMISRLGQMILTLFILVVLTFVLFRAVPGDPGSVVVGPDVDPAVAADIREQYGLDRPLLLQFVSYCNHLLHGDLGTSFQYKIPVTQVIAEKMTSTLVLVLPAIVLAVGLGTLLGAYAAAAGRRLDDAVRNFAFVMKASPIFWVSTLALMLFSYRLGWLPSIGMRTSSAESGGSWLGTVLSLDFLHHLLLPLAILTLYYAIEPTLTMRTSMKEALDQEFISLGKAQGLPRHRVVFRHGARNALLPVVSLAPVLIDNIIGGQIIVETVFSWPGMGRAVVDAVANFDYPTLQGIFLITACAVIVVNALIDVLYTYLDPRVRLT